MIVAVATTQQGGKSIQAKAYADIPGHVSIDMDKASNCHETGLGDVYEEDFTEGEDCGWTQGIYNVEVEKESNDMITVREVG